MIQVSNITEIMEVFAVVLVCSWFTIICSA